MSPSPQLAPAGSSSYDSDTMSVGDGTWDTSRNTFLLPNLVGLNFDTMRYNGKPCVYSGKSCATAYIPQEWAIDFGNSPVTTA